MRAKVFGPRRISKTSERLRKKDKRGNGRGKWGRDGSERTCLRITMQKFSVVDFASSANSLTVPDTRLLPRWEKRREGRKGGEHEGTLMHNGGGATRSTYTRSLPRSRIV